MIGRSRIFSGLEKHKALDAVTGGEVGQEIATLLSTKGVTLLAWGENGFREMSNSKRPVATPADMEGMKIRVVGTPLFIDTMKALGAKVGARHQQLGYRDFASWIESHT